MRRIGNIKSAKKYIWALYFLVVLKNPVFYGKKKFALRLNVTIFTAVLVLLLTLVQDVQFNITRNLTHSLAGHITVSGEYKRGGKEYKGVLHYPQIIQIVGQVLSRESRIVPRYVLSLPVFHKHLKRQAQFIGVDVRQERKLAQQLTFIAGSWDEFERSPDGILLPLAIARYFKVDLNDKLTVRPRSAAVDEAGYKIIRVAGIYRSNNYFLRSLILAHFHLLQKLDAAAEDTASNLCIFVADTGKTAHERDRLIHVLAQFGLPASESFSGKEESPALNSHFPPAAATRSGYYRWQEHASLMLTTADEVLGKIGRLVYVTQGIGIILIELMLFIVGFVIFMSLKRYAKQEACVKEFASRSAVYKPGEEGLPSTGLYIMENLFWLLVFILLGIGLAVLILLFIHYSLSNCLEEAFWLIFFKNS